MGQTQHKHNNNKPQAYVLKSELVEIHVLNIGCIIQKILMKDAEGNVADIVLGFDDLKTYLKNGHYFGAIVGRVANRIANAKFTLDDQEYNLTPNDKPNSLHGGTRGFDKRIWTTEVVENNKLQFVYLSRNGEEGYPGELFVKVALQLSSDNELHTCIEASTDSPTIVNLAQHSYYNLRGHNSNEAIMEQQLKLYADSMTPVDDNRIPTGEINKVKGTPYDFTEWRKIGGDMFATVGGYDNNFVIDKSAPSGSEDANLKLCAQCWDPVSKRAMDVYSNKPCLQLYSSGFLDKVRGKQGAIYNKHQAFCLEPQDFPDAVNHPEFPSIVIRESDTYVHKMIHRFYIKN